MSSGLTPGLTVARLVENESSNPTGKARSDKIESSTRRTDGGDNEKHEGENV